MPDKERTKDIAGVANETDLTVLVPLYNEADSVEELHQSVVETVDALGLSLEMIFVDDGSTDGSDAALARIHKRDSRVKVITFRRNFGKSAALSVGFAEAKGKVIITMDGDLQDDPHEIPNLLKRLDEGYDLVSGWKVKRFDPITKTLPSRFFNFVTAKMTGIPLHDFNCGLKAYRREAAKSLNVYGELHRFLPVLAHWSGFRAGEIPVLHHRRKYGRTKFGAARFVNGFLDLLAVMFLTSDKSPLHFLGRVAIVLLAVGLAISAYFGAFWLTGHGLRVRPLLLFGLVLVILGIQFISMGLLGEMIASSMQRRDYGIKKRLEVGPDGPSDRGADAEENSHR
jgi:glycosyltransferase involved in cell wall biosynthesis